MKLPYSKFKSIAATVMSDESPIPVTISIMQAWLLISGLQLASKHPAISQHMREALTDIGRQFSASILERHPDAEECLEMGWKE